MRDQPTPEQTPERIAVPDDHRERFWAHVDRGADGCWQWRGGRGRQGYGIFRLNGRALRAHRVAWVLAHGDIPGRLMVCHHCDNPSCVRPDHLFLGTALDNSADMMRKNRFVNPQASKTHCKFGHPLTVENTLVSRRRDGRNERECLLCKKRRNAERDKEAMREYERRRKPRHRPSKRRGVVA